AIREFHVPGVQTWARPIFAGSTSRSLKPKRSFGSRNVLMSSTKYGLLVTAANHSVRAVLPHPVGPRSPTLTGRRLRMRATARKKDRKSVRHGRGGVWVGAG